MNRYKVFLRHGFRPPSGVGSAGKQGEKSYTLFRNPQTCTEDDARAIIQRVKDGRFPGVEMADLRISRFAGGSVEPADLLEPEEA